MRLLRLTAAAVVLSMVAVACTHGSPDRPVPTVTATNVVTRPLLPTNVMELPSFDPASFQQLMDQLKGTPVVVNVWASWCKPCEEETPLLVKAAKSSGGKVQFLGVDIQDARSSAQTFLRKYGVTYPSVYDATGAVKRQLGFVGQPDTVFYDASGRPVEKVPQQLDQATLQAGLAKITAS